MKPTKKTPRELAEQAPKPIVKPKLVGKKVKAKEPTMSERITKAWGSRGMI